MRCGERQGFDMKLIRRILPNGREQLNRRTDEQINRRMERRNGTEEQMNRTRFKLNDLSSRS